LKLSHNTSVTDGRATTRTQVRSAQKQKTERGNQSNVGYQSQHSSDNREKARCHTLIIIIKTSLFHLKI